MHKYKCILEDFSMSMKTIITKYEPMDADTYIGRVGEAWLDNEKSALHIGDNTTPGGNVVRGTGNLLVSNDTIATMDNGEIFLQTGATSNKFFWAECGSLKWNYNDTFSDTVAKDSQGNTYALGATYNADAPNPSAFLVKYSPTGEMLWNRVLVDDTDGYPSTYGAGISVSPDDTVAVTVGLENQNEPYNYIAFLNGDGNMLISYLCEIDYSNYYDFFAMGDSQWGADNNLYQIANHYYDAGEGGSHMQDIPFRFLPAMVAGLSYYLSLKIPGAFERSQYLKAEYEQAYQLAADEDREKAAIRLAPRMQFIR